MPGRPSEGRAKGAWEREGGSWAADRSAEREGVRLLAPRSRAAVLDRVDLYVPPVPPIPVGVHALEGVRRAGRQAAVLRVELG
eukprot:3037396-Alexandrium_andersonii.AAC.1